uniref:ubiquitinyl hydrolase 1 n=1 Tax=Nomascus leucogenys TaxID=61853 RepID=A0A2I3GDS3_NOMLE
MACIHCLRENREKFEAFIEGSFEEYLKRLENPQEWVGQMEISALPLMYRKDFIIYWEPNVSPSQVTENNFLEKVLLCFSDGNHYAIVYPIKYKESSSMCQSLLYELLYEKVFKTDVSKIVMELDTLEVAAEDNSEISDSEDDSCKSKTAAADDVNGFKPLSGSEQLKNNGNSTSLPLSRKVLKSLNPAVYRNVEYEIWLKSKQAQQKRDYSIAAGLQYEVGNKCQVRLDHNGKFLNADVQGVHSENGPVLVEELGKQHTSKNLKAPPPESWNTVSGKKMKKPSTSEQNFHSDMDYRGPKNPSKPIKAPSALPPRLQHPSGVRQRAFSSHSSGSQSQKFSSEHKNLSRTPSQIIRKPDRERVEDFDHTSQESISAFPQKSAERTKFRTEMNRLSQPFPAHPSQSMCPEKLDKRPEPSTLENITDDKYASFVTIKVKEVRVPFSCRTKASRTCVFVKSSSPSSFSRDTSNSCGAFFTSHCASLANCPCSNSLPVSVQAVNQPLMPLPQTLRLYQDPLYPGFPCNEKGDRDLPKDKNILRFFFNLGVRTYSCPMWAPHSYLYPLHQAYLAACRVYPKVPVPVYPHNPWFQEAPAAQNESDCTCTDAHFPMQTEASVNGQMPQPEIGPPTFSSPLVIPPSQVSESHGQLSYQADLESEASGQLLHADSEESRSGKNMFPQPSFGLNPFLGPVPIAPPFFPHVWYGYPFQGFIENPVMRQNIVLPSDEKGELDLSLENLDLGEHVHSLPEASVSSKPDEDMALASIPPVAEGKAHPPTQILNRERETVPVELEPKRTIQSLKEKTEKVKDPKTAADVVSPGANSVDSRVQRPKEESLEDENEVSNILRSGRSKQFYNQIYGSRKYKSDWGYSGRGGYQHVRSEESWKGQPSRSRDEGCQYHRNVRGRLFRGDRRRSGMGDGHRGQHT